MAKILLGWEYGGGFGHISSLVFLGQALQRAGHSAVIAVSQLEATRAVWEGKGIEVVGTPLLKGRPRSELPAKRKRSGTFADTLTGLGTFTPDRLIAVGRGWARMLANFDPDLVICESSPHLALQTRRRIPTIAIGDGYSIPPAGRPLPLLRFWENGPPDAESVHNEKVLLENVNAAAAQLGLGVFEHIADLFGGDEAFVCCLPELDCYRSARTTPAIGALNAAPVLPRTTTGRGVFAYLAAKEDSSAWLEGMGRSGIPAEAYIRNGHVGPTSHTVAVHEKPVDLRTVLPSKALLFHHGGLSTAETALRLGIPQLIMPNHLEQRLTANLLTSYAVGESISHEQARQPMTLARHLGRMASDRKLQAAARRLAETIAARAMRPAIDIVIEAIGRHL